MIQATRTTALTAALAVCLVGCITNNPQPNDNNAVEPGIVETFAGTGTAAFSGDDGPADAADLNAPLVVTADPDGAIVIADSANHRVRRVDPDSGTITTIAGNGSTEGDSALDSPAGLAFDTAGRLYVSAADAVFRYDDLAAARTLVVGDQPDPGDCPPNQDVAAAGAAVLAPTTLDILSGELLLAEPHCHRIRRVTAGAVLQTFAGTGTPGYSGDTGPAIDAQFSAIDADSALAGLGFAVSPESPPDEVYIADTANHVIREINLFTGEIETFAGSGQAGYADGPPEQAMFNAPTAVFLTQDHAVWVVDSGNHAIRRIDPLGTSVTTVAGTGSPGFNGDGRPADETQLNDPRGVFISQQGEVYIADTGNHRIRRFATRSSAD